MDEAERRILDLVTEDYYELWEIAWIFARPQGGADADRAREILSAMISEGLVDVYQGEQFAGGEQRLTADMALRALSIADWSINAASGRHLRVVATATGDAAYNAQA